MSPNQSAMSAQLNKAAVRRMVLAALVRPLYFRLNGAMAEVSSALSAGRKPLVQTLQDGLRSAWADPAVRAALATWATPQANAKAAKSIPGAVAFETGANLSALTMARRGVSAALQPTALTRLIADQHFSAMMGLHTPLVALSDSSGASANVRIDIAGTAWSDVGSTAGQGSGVWNAAATGTAATNAAGIADQVIGAAPVTGARIPPVRPSTTLLGQINALPAAWKSTPAALAGSLGAAAVTPQLTAAILGSMAAGGGAATLTSPRQVYVALLNFVQQIGLAVGTNSVSSAVKAQVKPLIDANVAALDSAVKADVDAIMDTPAGALAARGPKDPRIAALASQMRGQLVTEMVSTIGANPLNLRNPGGSAPAQSVTFSTQGMMSDNTASIRPDQFTEMVQQFNTAPGLKKRDEEDFKAVKP